MAAVVLLGSSPPSTESTISPKISFAQIDRSHHGSRKSRLFPPNNPSHAAASSSSGICGCGGAAFSPPGRGLSAGKFRLGFVNFARVGFSAEESEEEEEDRKREWEEQLRSRIKDLEESKELERTAEDVQRRIMAEEGDSEDQKRERVRMELQKLAKEQAERRETAKLMFDLGQKAYGRGMYSKAVEFLEGALTIIPRPTLLGGEIQIWLAMAYEANKRHKDCIELYLQLEKTHPSVRIRRQAAELRYILQAPKLKISRDEMVTIPLIGSSYDRYAGTWSDKYKDQEKKLTSASQPPSSKDNVGDFGGWTPPADWQKDRALWVAVTLLLALIGLALLQG